MQNRERSQNGHFMRGRLLNVLKTRAIVQPMGHKKYEEIEFQYLTPWRSKMPEEIRHAFNSFPKIELEKKEEQRKVFYQNSTPLKQEISDEKRQELKQEAIKLFHMGKKYHEIAVIVGLPLGTVNTTLTKYRKRNKIQSFTKGLLPVKKIEVKEEAKKVVPEKVEVLQLGQIVQVKGTKATFIHAIRSILDLSIPDTSKLLAIEGLVSHE